MNFAFDEEQEALRDSVRRFLDDKTPETEVRRLMETDEGYDPDVWSQMAELGLQGIAIPEEFGGAGFGFLELTVVFEEMGRRLVCAPYFSTVAMAAPLLLALEDKQAQIDYLPKIADGSLIAAVGLSDLAGSWDLGALGGVAATRDGEAWALSGEKHYVIDGHTADVVFVIARTGDELSVFAVDRGANGFTSELASTMDTTRKLARLSFDGTPARLIGTEDGATAAVARMLDLAAVALAAEQVGGAQEALNIAVAYAKIRYQFGRPIGTFQAIKHKCANMLTGLEAAKSAAYYAGWAISENDPEVPVLASVAKAYCSDVYRQVAGETIQIHGGIGFTWECSAHLYFKRAKSSALLFGSPEYHRNQLLTRLGI